MRRRDRNRAAQGAARDHVLYRMQVRPGSARAKAHRPLGGADPGTRCREHDAANTMIVRKAVIVAAGFGTRMLSASRRLPDRANRCLGLKRCDLADRLRGYL